MSLLTPWANFYVVVGSAAATLTGLMFVVITLAARRGRVNESMAAFGTPTVVHLCTALFGAAVVCAPWPALEPVALLLGLAGLGGVVYVGIVVRRTRRQTDYQPVFEDWLWHTILPFVSYAGLLLAALVLLRDPVPALFVAGAGAVLFLFIGIHNTWDTVTYIALRPSSPENTERDEAAGR